MAGIRALGLIGLGVMGGPMCTNLIREEYYPIRVKLLKRKEVPS
ncbi:MAG: hypothetical protein EOP32_03235 [Rhodococcus sp. (in: high G+C Gram-positive bacteria)]|nr:MAG: hypothetical protein EOP32_03235 [Rhodococcus sp. (in: high G+C Gram-positive bacteria)]